MVAVNTCVPYSKQVAGHLRRELARAMTAAAIFGLIVLVAVTAGQNLKEAEDKCENNLQPRAEVYDKIRKGKYEELKDLPEAKDFIKCYQLGVGVLNKDGKIDAKKAKEVVSKIPTSKGVSTEDRNKTIDTCAKASEEKGTKTEKAFAFYVCYFKGNPDDLKSIFPPL